jgi:hypothetical protein
MFENTEIPLLGALPWSGNPTGAHPLNPPSKADAFSVGEPDHENAPSGGLRFMFPPFEGRADLLNKEKSVGAGLC